MEKANAYRLNTRKDASIADAPREALLHGPARKLLGLILVLGSVVTASAFKIDTHVWITQQVLNDLADDGKLRIGDLGDFQVREELLLALRSYPDAYRLGSIGPDGFPDFVGGQMTTHPGPSEEWSIPVEEGWVTDDWLRWVLGHANKPEEVAFAHGYLTHAASDVFAHTYVNTYAGDSFEFTDEQEVELRHMSLENFILKHQPPLVDYFGIEIYDARAVDISDDLARWLAATLIANDEVARQYQGAGVFYLKRMQDLLNQLDQVIADAEEASRAMNDGLRSLRKRISGLRNKKVRIDLGWFGSVKVSLFPAYCFIDPGSCVALLVTEGHLAATEKLNREAFNQGLQPLRDWRHQVQRAVEAYCMASRDVAVEMLRDKDDHERPPFPAERDPLQPLRQWAICWGPAFAGVPSQVTDPLCGASRAFDSLLAIEDRYRSMEKSLTGLLGELEWVVAPHNAVGRVKTKLTEILEAEFSRIASDISGEDSVLFDMIQLRNEENLVEVFSADSSSKRLLVLPDIQRRIRADMGIGSDDEVWDPAEYAVIAHAITLSKLLLLDAAELNRLAGEAGVTCSVYGPSPFVSEPDFNVLLGFIRSIDGNHQWQEYGLPYARQGGWDRRPKELRHFGYYWGEQAMSSVAHTEAQPGFRLWQDAGLREKVFLRLFSKPLLAKDLLPASHPSSSSLTNPFPFAVESKEPDPLEDCLNSFLLTSETLTDLVFKLPAPNCVPDSAEDVLFQWGFIDDCVYECVTPASYEESVDWDRFADAEWTITSPCHPLLPGLGQFSGSLDALASEYSEEATDFLEAKSYDPFEGLLTIHFHTRQRVPTLGIGRWDLPDNTFYEGSLICNPRSASPVFIKGPVDDLLLELHVSWAAEGLGGILGLRESCTVRYRIVESRSAALADITRWTELGMSPCDVPPNEVVPIPPLDHSVIRSIRDRWPPALRHAGDLDLAFGEQDWTLRELRSPEVYDDWHRSDELTIFNDAPAVFPLGTTFVNWTASDPEGNVVTTTQRITILDLEPPRFVVSIQPAEGFSDIPNQFILDPVELLQEGDGLAPAHRLQLPVAVDNHPGEVSVTMVDPPESFALGESVVTWIARDASGNETEAWQLVRVRSLMGDVDLDGDVDDDDAAIIASGVGQAALGVGRVAPEDFNEDGLVDSADEALRQALQGHIDSTTSDLRDLNRDDWITTADVAWARTLRTSEAHFSFESDFDTLEPQASLLGEALLDQGRLKLSASGIGSLRVTPPSMVRRVTSMRIAFDIQFEAGTFPTGEGLSFSFAPDLPEAPFGTEGAGSGLKVSLDFGTSRAAPSMGVWFGRQQLGASGALSFLKGDSSPMEFVLRITPEHTIDIWLNNRTEHLIFSELPGYAPIAGRFGIGARTTRLSDGQQWMDDLVVHAVYEPPLSSPSLSVLRLPNASLEMRLKGIGGQSYRVEVSPDLANWSLWDSVTVPANESEVNTKPLSPRENRSRFFRATEDP